jgi:hypothetical protein
MIASRRGKNASELSIASLARFCNHRHKLPLFSAISFTSGYLPRLSRMKCQSIYAFLQTKCDKIEIPRPTRISDIFTPEDLTLCEKRGGAIIVRQKTPPRAPSPPGVYETVIEKNKTSRTDTLRQPFVLECMYWKCPQGF